MPRTVSDKNAEAGANLCGCEGVQARICTCATIVQEHVRIFLDVKKCLGYASALSLLPCARVHEIKNPL